MEPAGAGLRGGEFAGLAFRTLQWVFRAVIWCKRKSSPCVTHLGRKRGAVTLWAAGALRAASLRAGLASVRCADPGSGLKANTTSANERAGCCEAHRGLGSKRGPAQRLRRRGPAAKLGGVLADGSRQGVSGPAEQSRKSGRGTARGRGIQGGQSTSGGEKFRQRRSSPAADARRNPGAGVAKLVGPKFGEILGAEA